MKVVSFLNLKGGVGKTVSAANFAHILATLYSRKVVLIDNDPQGNASAILGATCAQGMLCTDNLYSADTIDDAVIKTDYENLDVVPTTSDLVSVNKALESGSETYTFTAFKNNLFRYFNGYDYVVIDNPPEINNCTIAAMSVTDDVIIPVRADYFSYSGLNELVRHVDNIRRYKNNIRVCGCLLTAREKNRINIQFETLLHSQNEIPYFDTTISKSVKVPESTFERKPLMVYSRGSRVTHDYINFTGEYLTMKEVV